MDEYAKQLQKQNAGGRCDHCGAALGHYARCLLLTAESILPEVQRVEYEASFYRPERFKATMHVPELVLTEEDERFLHEINKAFN